MLFLPSQDITVTRAEGNVLGMRGRKESLQNCVPTSTLTCMASCRRCGVWFQRFLINDCFSVGSLLSRNNAVVSSCCSDMLAIMAIRVIVAYNFMTAVLSGEERGNWTSRRCLTAARLPAATVCLLCGMRTEWSNRAEIQRKSSSD